MEKVQFHCFWLNLAEYSRCYKLRLYLCADDSTVRIRTSVNCLRLCFIFQFGYYTQFLYEVIDQHAFWLTEKQFYSNWQFSFIFREKFMTSVTKTPSKTVSIH